VPFPVGDRSEFTRVKPVLRRGGPASGHEFVDESPVRQVNPVTVENVAHGRTLQLMLAQSLQGGVTRLTGEKAQPLQVVHETLRDAHLITFHELSLSASANESKPPGLADSNASGILRILPESGADSSTHATRGLAKEINTRHLRRSAAFSIGSTMVDYF